MKRFFRISIYLLFSTIIINPSLSENSGLEEKPDKHIFSARRQKLMGLMKEGLAVFRSESDKSDFYYLTGFDESPAIGLLIPGEKEQFILFVQPKDPMRALWVGERYGLEAAKEIFGANKAYSLDQFDQVLHRYLRGKTKVYCSFSDKELYEKLLSMIQNPHGNWPRVIENLRVHIHEMRLIKDAEELKLLSKAVDITCQSLQEAMKALKPGMYEYEIEAIIEFIFKKNGSHSGFPPIIGSGPNSTVLHYHLNNRQTQDGELILMDVGAEYGFYKADVTRTVPVSGKFNQEQKEIYKVVLKAQQEAINLAAPGIGIREIDRCSVNLIKEGLHRLGLITDKESHWQHRLWLMYNTNHWIGLDVHDVGGRGEEDGIGRRLKPGMVFTVEPGLYIRKDTLDNIPRRLGPFSPDKEEIVDFVNKVKPAVNKYSNIGIRIEDDVLITESGHKILSQKAPKEIDAIERLMKKRSLLIKK